MRPKNGPKNSPKRPRNGHFSPIFGRFSPKTAEFHLFTFSLFHCSSVPCSLVSDLWQLRTDN